jgi:hypothetical protein
MWESSGTNKKVKSFVVDLGHEAEFLLKEETDPEITRITELELISGVKWSKYP